MTKWQLFGIGIIILVVAPSLLGLLTARFLGWALGVFIGMLALASILSIYYRKIQKGVKTQNKTEPEQRHKNPNQGGEQ